MGKQAYMPLLSVVVYIPTMTNYDAYDLMDTRLYPRKWPEKTHEPVGKENVTQEGLFRIGRNQVKIGYSFMTVTDKG